MISSQWSLRRGVAKKPRRGRIPLRLEVLEARNLLSNVLVNSTAADTTAQDTQSETSIALGKNSSAVVVAFNDSGENVGGANHFTGFAQSTNGGSSFTDLGALPASSHGDAGDPALAVNNSTGTIYLSTLPFSSSNTLEFYTSTNNGASFGSPVNSAPGFSSSHFLDKDALAVDNASGTGNGAIYQTFNDFSNGGFTDNGIFLTRSTNGGTTWGPSGGLKITTNGNNVEGSDVTVGPDHSVYVFWWDGNSSTEKIMMKKANPSLGQSFGSQITVANLKTTGTDGDLNLNTGNAGPTPNTYFRSNAFPTAVVNPTNAQDIYVTYDDVGQAAGDKADVYFTESTNGGTTWSTPIRVNDDTTTTDQWQPAMAVTPDGTHLMITWYDRRNDPSNSLIDRYATIGTITNGGATVTFGPNFKVTEPDSGSTTSSFPAVVGQDPAVVSSYMGDYDQVAADNTYFYTTWGDNRLGDASHTNQPDVRFEKITMNGTIVFSPQAGALSAGSNAAASGSSTPATAATGALRSGAARSADAGSAPSFAASSPAAAPANSTTSAPGTAPLTTRTGSTGSDALPQDLTAEVTRALQGTSVLAVPSGSLAGAGNAGGMTVSGQSVTMVGASQPALSRGQRAGRADTLLAGGSEDHEKDLAVRPTPSTPVTLAATTPANHEDLTTPALGEGWTDTTATDQTGTPSGVLACDACFADDGWLVNLVDQGTPRLPVETQEFNREPDPALALAAFVAGLGGCWNVPSAKRDAGTRRRLLI